MRLSIVIFQTFVMGSNALLGLQIPTYMEQSQQPLMTEMDLPLPTTEMDLHLPSTEMDLPLPSAEMDLHLPSAEMDLPLPSAEMDLPSTMDLVLTDDFKRTVGKKVVLQISSILPKVDTIGHDILHANNQFVVEVLSNDSMSIEFKKTIILLSIKLAQYGDDLGSFFLQQYYNIVDFVI